VSAIHDALRASGIWKGDEVRPVVRVAYGRLARVLRARRVRTLGLVPAGDGVAVPAVAIELARALVHAAAADVAVVDPLGRWTGAERSARDAGAERWYATEWIADRVAVLSPVTADAAMAVPLLRAILRDELANYLHLVVDLTGFDRLGERAAASELLDGCAVVARSGQTRQREVARVLAELDERRALGVVLTGL
jgi:hypothetical protein